MTGAYVGFATVGIFVQWYLQHGVTWEQLSHWGHCVEWPVFTPLLQVGRWPAHVMTITRKHGEGPPQAGSW